MARFIESLHHGGARAQNHREHRSKKGRENQYKKRPKKPFYVEKDNERIEREEYRFSVKIWRTRSAKKHNTSH